MPYFRCWPTDEDPKVLLEPSEQYSTPWGEPERGHCDKCGGSGEVDYRCRSCLAGCSDDCPACAGRVTYRGECPTCEGDGNITRTKRRGVSVFPTVDGLYAYLVERQVDLGDQRILELEGPLSGDRDLDADAGALLVFPERIVRILELDPGRIAEAKRTLPTTDGTG